MINLVDIFEKIDLEQILTKNQDTLNTNEVLDLQIIILHKFEKYEKIVELLTIYRKSEGSEANLNFDIVN